jgi:D-alanyl-D-alanine carboxypeptidase
VFEPFGLEDTTFEPGRIHGRYLHGHMRASRDGVATGRLRDTEPRTALSHWAAGAVVSTARDLDRFFSDILADELGRRLVPRTGASYGLGVARLPTECGSMIGHTGNILGTVSIVGKRGDRLLVIVANVYPFTPAQEAALQELLDRGLCG